MLADKLNPLSRGNISDSVKQGFDESAVDKDKIYKNYLHFFKVNTFYID